MRAWTRPAESGESHALLGSVLLSQAEKYDQYRFRCSRSELNDAARKDHKYEPSFTDSATSDFMNTFAAQTPLLHDATIVILHPSADNGYPHTRPNNLICMPSNACGQTDKCKETLIHEAIHLAQRSNLGAWSSYCRKEGWTPQHSDTISPRFIDKCRINPDTLLMPFWSWQDYYVPLPLFSREIRPTLSDVEIKWLDLRNNILMPAPASFTLRYGNPSQPEHPFELSAVEIAAKGIKTHKELDHILQG